MSAYKMFISSPGDVGRERHLAEQVIRRVAAGFHDRVDVQPYFWEYEPMESTRDYQENIPLTSDFDWPLTSNQSTGLNGIAVPGTLRDSLVLLAVVLEQQTELQLTQIRTDTGAYSDVVYGLFRLMGYRFSPRLADISGSRFWRIDPKADYGQPRKTGRIAAALPRRPGGPVRCIRTRAQRHCIVEHDLYGCRTHPTPRGRLFLRDEDVARLSPLTHEHINMLGRYSFVVREPVVRGELRPLRTPADDEP